MVLATACFLGGWATNSIVPVTVNYIIECFMGNASESAAIMGLYRLAFSLTIPFFVDSWIERVGSGWCLGMAAFFSVLSYSTIILLIWKGQSIRLLSFMDLSSNEGGTELIQRNRVD